VAAEDTSAAAADNRVSIEQRGNAPDTLLATGEVTTLSATQVGITNRESTGGGAIQHNLLSINLGSTLNYSVGTFAGPTSTGDVSYTGPGFEPSFLLNVFSMLTGFIDEDAGNTSAAAMSFYVGMATVDDEFCLGTHAQDTADPTNNGGYTNNTLAATRDQADGSALLAGSLVSFDANGWTTNYPTSVPGSAFQNLYLAIEAAAAATGDPAIASHVTRMANSRRIRM
jgi:hypothetical protein